MIKYSEKRNAGEVVHQQQPQQGHGSFQMYMMSMVIEATTMKIAAVIIAMK